MRPFARISMRFASLPATIWIVAVLISLQILAQAGFVYESLTELSASGDFNGDGLEDLVVADKTRGTYRLGFAQADDTYGWVKARASGIESATGLAIGRLLTASRDGTVRQYMLALSDLLALADRRLTRGLTPEERVTYLGESPGGP